MAVNRQSRSWKEDTGTWLSDMIRGNGERRYPVPIALALAWQLSTEVVETVHNHYLLDARTARTPREYYQPFLGLISPGTEDMEWEFFCHRMTLKIYIGEEKKYNRAEHSM